MNNEHLKALPIYSLMIKDKDTTVICRNIVFHMCEETEEDGNRYAIITYTRDADVKSYQYCDMPEIEVR